VLRRDGVTIPAAVELFDAAMAGALRGTQAEMTHLADRLRAGGCEVELCFTPASPNSLNQRH
jgi:hypothetical protein